MSHLPLALHRLRRRNLSQLRPGSKTLSGAKDGHVHADFGDNGRGRQRVHAGDGHQQGLLGGKGTHGGTDRGLDLGQITVDLPEAADVQAEQQALVLGERAVQRQGEPVDLAPQPPFGEVGHGGRGGAALGQGAQHQHAGHAKHAAHHACELDAGAFEQLERAVAFRGHGADQRLAVTHQVAHHPDVRGWHEARAHQPMADQVGDPLGVLHVRLASSPPAIRLRSRRPQGGRRGTLRMCDALPTMTVTSPSRAACTGCQ